MKVFAYYTSPISGTEHKFELVLVIWKAGDVKGYSFQNVETCKYEKGTYTEDKNKFDALDKFKKIYGDMNPRFELVG